MTDRKDKNGNGKPNKGGNGVSDGLKRAQNGNGQGGKGKPSMKIHKGGKWGIVNLAKGAGFAGVLACFEAWYERDGGGNREDRQIIKNTRDFLQAHGKSSKYSQLKTK